MVGLAAFSVITEIIVIIDENQGNPFLPLASQGIWRLGQISAPSKWGMRGGPAAPKLAAAGFGAYLFRKRETSGRTMDVIPSLEEKTGEVFMRTIAVLLSLNLLAACATTNVSQIQAPPDGDQDGQMHL